MQNLGINLHHSALSRLNPVESGTLGKRVYDELRNFLMVGGVQPGEMVIVDGQQGLPDGADVTLETGEKADQAPAAGDAKDDAKDDAK